ncbi:MAG: phosphoenolpyruvate--protein phosphotransferase [Planctomycetota bacterium]
MDIRQGVPASPGITIGRVFLLEAEGVRIAEHFIDPAEVDRELERLENGFEEALQELEDLAEDVQEKAGTKIAEIFVAHAGMLRDESFREEFYDRIRDKHFTAEFAVSRTMRHWRKVFKRDEFLAPRVADLEDLERRLLRHLLGEKREELSSLKEQVVLVAHDLKPSQIASVDTEHVQAFATDVGGPTSHTSIIASALGLPAVVGLGGVTNEVSGGDMMIVDGDRGTVICDPDEETLERYRTQRDEHAESDRALVEELRDQPAETTDGRRLNLMVNIESPKEIGKGLDYGGEAIGLYRTEFLYMTRDEPPTEADHMHAYVDAIKQLEGRPLTIRTLDLGADKFMEDDPLMEERNPFLGLRSLRLCLDQPEIFEIQLRAILKASALGPVRLMFPLVTDLRELEQAWEILLKIQDEFDRKGEEYDEDMPVGIMIEVPSAAVCADVLARHCDFFSIGTNDLIQYTLAVDRANEHVADLYRPEAPSVLRLIKMTVEAARNNGIPVGMCGEMASAVIYTPLLLGLGIDTLSVAPVQVLPEVKKIVRSISYAEAQELASDVLKAEHPDIALQRLEERCRELLPELLGTG